MSYLNCSRLVFSGDFQADVNTVNNDVRHYYNPAFTEDNWVQDVSTQGGWWNPDGGSTFRFVNCAVKQVCYPDGSKTSEPDQDLVIGGNVTGPLNESSAKLVDLDPQFQFTSQIWGLKLCIYDKDNGLLFRGTIAPSGFKDLQFRNPSSAQQINGQPLGASWTSVIHDLEWGEKARHSKILSELMDHSASTGLLSCNLVSFGYFKKIGGKRFTLGRLLGTIAPYTDGEPKQYAPARRIIGLGNQEFKFSNSVYDETQSRLTIDLGGSFPLADPMGTPTDVGPLYLGVAKQPTVRDSIKVVKEDKKLKDGSIEKLTFRLIKKDEILPIGEIKYKEKDWILNTAGISDFTVNGEAKELIENRQIVLFTDKDAENYNLLACETKNGLSIRADDNVKRIDPKPTGSVDFNFKITAYQWGKKLPKGKVTFKRYTPAELSDDPGSCTDPKVPTGIDPDSGQVIQPCTNWPSTSVLINGKNNVVVTTDEHGEATVTVSVFNPNNPRGYIDGQIFLISYLLEGLPMDQQYNLSFMGLWLMDGLIMHVRNAFEEIKEPHWNDIAEIMTQYRNLYPLMSRNIIDLSDPKEIAARKKIMHYAFTRDLNDPTYMPVTRDLSEGKRKTIVNWLTTGMKGADEAANMPLAMTKPSTPPIPDGGNPTSQKLNTKTKDDFG